MMRRATKKTRGRNAAEKRFQHWVAQQPCIICKNPLVLVDHCKGSTFRHQKTLIGHWFVLPLCAECDAVKTQGSHRRYEKTFGESQAATWIRLIKKSPITPPDAVFQAISDLAKTY